MMCSKIVICILLLGLAYAEKELLTASKDVTDGIKVAITKCTTKDDNIPQYLTLVASGKYKEDDGFKRLVHCAYFASGFADENGRVLIDKAAKAFGHDERFVAAMKKCDKVGANPIETTFESFKCFMETSPVLVKYQ